MKRVLSSEITSHIDQLVTMAGWVHARRDHGKLIFIDLRDRAGLTQVVFLSDNEDTYKIGDKLRSEWVVEIEGLVKKRPEKMINPNILSGTVELEAKKVKVLNESKTLPFEIDKDTSNIEEEVRMLYRYLDLRSERMRKNLIMRANLIDYIRHFYINQDFIEVETPMLTKGTPEGAREYVVPSRLHHGKFYVLPQSPQQFKQLLMIAGLERYFQIARVFRDEDPRGDRQPEFTQIDVEMSFADADEIRQLFEECITGAVKNFYPNKKITQIPFPVLTYQEAMEKYNTDKPDLRANPNNSDELAFCWVKDFPLFEYSKTEKKLVSVHHPFTRPLDNDLDLLDSTPEKARAAAYDCVLNGFEIAGGSLRIHEKELQTKIFKILGLSNKEIENRFGHLLRAFDYGAPPMGGIAAGIDRICAILQNEPSIREVIAFPKTGDARDLMMGAPSEISPEQLKELGIVIRRKTK
jgi:aspartyl-tRNA synthetase